MTYRTKYYISVGLFVIATLYMLNVQGQVITKGMANQLDGWLIAQMFFSFAVLIVAIFVFIYYRARKNNADVTEEQLLMAATKRRDDSQSNRKP